MIWGNGVRTGKLQGVCAGGCFCRGRGQVKDPFCQIMRPAFFIPLCLSFATTFSGVVRAEEQTEVRKAIVTQSMLEEKVGKSAAPAAVAPVQTAPAAPANAPQEAVKTGTAAPAAAPATPKEAPALPAPGSVVTGGTMGVPPVAGKVEEEKPKRIVYVRCEVSKPVVALTFDDGPHPEFTPRLLDTLKKEGIKATFFMVGRCVASYPNIVKRMVDEGHEVANHSWSHPQLTAMSNAGVDSQMQRTHDAIIKACGVTPTLYRPPYGATRLSQQKRLHEQLGYWAILWDVDPLDWQTPRTVKKVHDRVLEQTKPGSIILCHDIHETTVDAMPATITDLKARGFQFMTVTELIKLEETSPMLPGSAPIVLAPMPAPLPVVEPPPPPLPPVKLKAKDRLSLDLPQEGKP